MPSGTGKSTKPSELFRERLVVRYYHLLPSLPEYGATSLSRSGSVPQSSSDTTLTAFAQLAALRLHAAHAFISLIDSRNQYVLAEATKSLSMQSDLRHDRNDALWLGSVVIPRNAGFCQLVLANHGPTRDAGTDTIDIVILHDPQNDPRFQNLQIPGMSDLRFYAGVPIMTHDGTKLGSFCVVDNKPHSPLSIEEKTFLCDMAKTTMDHLDAVRLRVDHQRKHKLVKGIESFIDGLTDLKSIPQEGNNRPQSRRSTSTIHGPGNFATRTANSDIQKDALRTPQPNTQISTNRPPKALWELALPSGFKSMFSRAATIIRQSGEYDGVAFFYMSSASTRTRDTQRSGRRVGSALAKRRDISHSDTTSSTNESSGESDLVNDSQNRTGQGKELDSTGLSSLEIPCPVLSFSLGKEDTDAQETGQSSLSDFKQRDMIRLLGKNPRGRTFTLNRDGEVYSGDTSSGSGRGYSSGLPSNKFVRFGSQGSEGSERSGHTIRNSQLSSLQKAGPMGKSFVCLPLWDFERQRWFAFAICWSNALNRDPGLDGDLHFLRIFGNSIMNALSHIDAIAANKAKTAFVSSISHELRSPLHGILGAANFLQDSHLDRFQQEMVDSVATSGRTLLETVDHVMDFAKMNSYTNQARQNLPHSESHKAEGGLSKSSLFAPMNFAHLVEEVLEIVLMGFYVQHDFVYPDEGTNQASIRLPTFNTTPQVLASSGRAMKQRGRVRIALQIPYLENWCIYGQPGAWRRVIMNLFSNALKYTHDGLIIVRLQPKKTGDSGTIPITLSFIDTGKGMSDDYLENRLFQPFSQEDSFASGTGLGLSIVDQLVHSMDGNIDIKSSVGVGTNVKINSILKVTDRIEPFTKSLETVDSIPSKVQSMRICILDQPLPESMNDVKHSSADEEFLKSLTDIMKDWFGVETTIASFWTPGTADVIICTRPSFAVLKTIRESASNARVPPIIIVSYDVLEMSVLQADARIAEGSSIVEIMSQPIGPRKIATVLDKCLERDQALALSQQEKADTISLAPSPYTSVRSLSRPPSAPQSTNHSPIRSSSENSMIESSGDPAVLIVDDNPLNLRLLETFLRNLKIYSYKATNGQEAVEVYKQMYASIQSILMDISMPIMDGMTATRHIRDFEKQSDYPRIPVIALTGLASSAARLEAQEAGMDAYLIKPVSFRRLRDMLPNKSPLKPDKGGSTSLTSLTGSKDTPTLVTSRTKLVGSS